jgi:hypothetical protein
LIGGSISGTTKEALRFLVGPFYFITSVSDLFEGEYETIRRHERSGCPLGTEDFVARTGKLTARDLKKKKPGPKRNN